METQLYDLRYSLRGPRRRQDKRGFLALANGDCPYLRVFVASFEREDAQRAIHARSRKWLPIWNDNAREDWLSGSTFPVPSCLGEEQFRAAVLSQQLRLLDSASAASSSLQQSSRTMVAPILELTVVLRGTQIHVNSQDQLHC